MANDNGSIPRHYLVPLRLWVGLSFLLAGQNKLKKDWGSGYADSVQQYVAGNLDNAYGFYRSFLENVVLENLELFAQLVGWGEFLFGLSVFLGFFTRLGAGIGIIIILNFTFASGRGIWLPGMDAAYIWALLTLGLGAAGRSWGLDGVLRKRWAGVWLT
jgi:uncharacterized membrane protein YphA (DoxX/SURF4 family)